MKVSTKGVYAIEAMIDLGYYSREKVESIRNIAKRRNLSEKYLEQIMGKLRRAGLIVSTRGAGGGYRLSKEAEHIFVLDILMAVEGDLAPVECLTADNMVCGMDCGQCTARKMWKEMWNKITEIVKQVTLQELIDEYERQISKKEPEFYI